MIRAMPEPWNGRLAQLQSTRIGASVEYEACTSKVNIGNWRRRAGVEPP
jgi:hypothetical protein